MLNKSVRKCKSLKSHSSGQPCEKFHFSDSLLTEKEGMRHLSTEHLSSGVFLDYEYHAWGGPAMSRCR